MVSQRALAHVPAVALLISSLMFGGKQQKMVQFSGCCTKQITWMKLLDLAWASPSYYSHLGSRLKILSLFQTLPLKKKKRKNENFAFKCLQCIDMWIFIKNTKYTMMELCMIDIQIHFQSLFPYHEFLLKNEYFLIY